MKKLLDRKRASKKELCRNKEMYVATLKEEDTQVVIDKRGCDRRCVISELTWSQQKNSMLRHTSKLKRGFRCCDKYFKVATHK